MTDRRRPLGILVLIGLLTALFAGSFIGAMHAPEPHDVPVAVVGPETAADRLQTALDAHAEGAFDLSAYANPDAARAALADREVDAVLIPGPDGSTLLTAGASGRAGAGIITAVFTAAAEAQGTSLTVTDVHPLSADDRGGTGLFFYLLSLLVPALAAGMMLALGTRLGRVGLPLALGGAAVVIAAVATSIADAATGVLPGAPAALFGVSALAAAAVSFAVAGLARLGGAVLGGLGALLLFPVGIPASGGPLGPAYIPEWYAAIGAVLPPGAAVEAVRNVVYFDGAALGRPMVVLACWLVAGAALLLVPRRRTAKEADEPASGTELGVAQVA